MTVINEKEIAHRLAKLHADLVERLGGQPYLEPSLTVYSHGTILLSVYDKSERDGGTSHSLVRCKGETFAEVISAAEAFVAAMPNADAMQRRNWHRKLSDVIDEGHALALPDEVMKPIRAGSQAMAKNLLTYEATE